MQTVLCARCKEQSRARRPVLVGSVGSDDDGCISIPPRSPQVPPEAAKAGWELEGPRTLHSRVCGVRATLTASGLEVESTEGTGPFTGACGQCERIVEHHQTG